MEEKECYEMSETEVNEKIADSYDQGWNDSTMLTGISLFLVGVFYVLYDKHQKKKRS